MMLFCPYDGELLLMGKKDGANRLECNICPYIFELRVPIYEVTEIKKKTKDDEHGPVDWSNASQAKIQCPKEGCNGDTAVFFQVQIRSADEPMTTFYKCMTCGSRWREN